MSDADWDADDYQPPEPVAKASNVNKWEGEDEEEDVKDNWEDEDNNEEEKKDSEKPPEAPKSAASKKPKKNLAEKIQIQEEKERLLREERAHQQELKNLTPAELQAEKMRQRKLQEESELELVKATYGVDTVAGEIDSASPSSKDEFDKLREAINNKVQDLAKAEPYVEFVTELVQSMVVNLPAADLKKLSTYMSSLATEKAKMDKAAGSKKKGGKFKGAKLKIDDRDLTSELDYDDMDDFM